MAFLGLNGPRRTSLSNPFLRTLLGLLQLFYSSKEANPGSIRGTLSPAAIPRVTGGVDASSTTGIVETYQELLKNRVIGETPNGEILCYPRWLVFNSPNGYKKPCYGDFTITNKDPFTVAWCIKAKEKMMRLSQSHGILKPGEHIDLTLYLISSDDWPRDVIEYTGRRLKIVVENLKVPDTIRPKSKLESSRMSKDIFHYSSSQSPLLRMYTKISILLE